MAIATWRLVRATVKFLPFIIAFARDRNRYILFGGSRKVTPERRTRRARKLKNTLISLGPTYIKLGQLLSTRPDVVPQEYIDELLELQDDVPPAPYPEIQKILEEEVGHPDSVYTAFERTAISGASLGQVHVGYYQGEKVAVKIRRPGVEELVSADLRVLNFFLPWTQRAARLMGESAHAESLGGLAEDFERRINQEMNYHREAEMLNEIKDNFRGDDRVVIPATYDEVCTERVLTMEYHGGIKINDVDKLERMGHDRERIAKNLEKIYLKMSLIDGVFHGDPHPGNLAVNEDEQIVIYDFGMSGRLSPSLQETFLDFYRAAADHDAEGVIDAMIEMGTLDRDVDRELMVDVIDVAIRDLSGEEVDELRIQQLMEEIEDTVYEYPLTIPSYISLGLRVSTIVEGVCIELDPEFDFLEVAREFFIEEGYVQKEVRGRAVQAFQDLEDTVNAIANAPAKLEGALDKFQRDDVEVVVEVEDSARHLRGMGRGISYALVGGSSIVGATVLTVSESPYTPYLFIFGLLMLYLSRRSFRDRRGAIGPKTYATRHQAEKLQEGSWRDREEESQERKKRRQEEAKQKRSQGGIVRPPQYRQAREREARRRTSRKPETRGREPSGAEDQREEQRRRRKGGRRPRRRGESQPSGEGEDGGKDSDEGDDGGARRGPRPPGRDRRTPDPERRGREEED